MASEAFQASPAQGHVPPDVSNRGPELPKRERPLGEFLHETRQLHASTKLPILRTIFARELRPIWPMFAATAAGFFLAGWIAGRTLGKNPQIRPRINKERRAHEVPEIDEPELVARLGRRFLEKDLIRDLVRRPLFRPLTEAMHDTSTSIVNPEAGRKDPVLEDVQEKTGKLSLEPGSAKARVQT